MNVRRLAVIVNPRGGKRNGLRVLERVRPIFHAAEIELEVHVTEQAGHASEIAKTLELQSFAGICAVGGDGTFHEVANGLMQRDKAVSIPIGIIPAGTGNSVAQHLQFDEPMEAAKRIVAGRFQPLDVVRVTLQDRVIHCVNIVGWGAVSDINLTDRKSTRLNSSHSTLSRMPSSA